MSWAKPKTGGLVGLMLATLVAGAGAALDDQTTKKAGGAASSQAAAVEPVVPVVRPADAAKPTGSSAVVIAMLPSRAELHKLLSRGERGCRASQTKADFVVADPEDVRHGPGQGRRPRRSPHDVRACRNGGRGRFRRRRGPSEPLAHRPPPGRVRPQATGPHNASSGCQGHARRGWRLRNG